LSIKAPGLTARSPLTRSPRNRSRKRRLVKNPTLPLLEVGTMTGRDTLARTAVTSAHQVVQERGPVRAVHRSSPARAEPAPIAHGQVLRDRKARLRARPESPRFRGGRLVQVRPRGRAACAMFSITYPALSPSRKDPWETKEATPTLPASPRQPRGRGGRCPAPPRRRLQIRVGHGAVACGAYELRELREHAARVARRRRRPIGGSAGELFVADIELDELPVRVDGDRVPLAN